MASSTEYKSTEHSNSQTTNMTETNRNDPLVDKAQTEQETVKETACPLSSSEKTAESKDTNKHPDPTALRKHAKEHHQREDCEICAASSESRCDYVVDLTDADVEFWKTAQQFLEMTVNDEPIIVQDDKYEDPAPAFKDSDIGKQPEPVSDDHAYDESMGFCIYDESEGFVWVENDKFSPLLNGEGNFRFNA